MSYEGKTANALKHAFTWSGQAYSSPVDPKQTSSFRYVSTRLYLRNTFHCNWMKLQSNVGYASTAWVYAMQFDPTANDPIYLRKWDMLDTDGNTVVNRWFPPYSHGFAAVNYRIGMNFNNSASNTGNRYLSLEY